MGDNGLLPDLDPVTNSVRLLISASRDLVVRMAGVMRMNTNDMTAVAMLMERGPMGVAELAEHLGIRQPSATALADRLERTGRVRRVRSTDDRRRVILAETPRARTSAHDAWRPGIMEIDAVCRALDEDERVVVQRFLAQVTEAMNRGGRADQATADEASADEATGDEATADDRHGVG